MKPTLIFSRDDEERVEVSCGLLGAIVAHILQRTPPLGQDIYDELMFFVQTDTLFLDEETAPLFLAIKDACEELASGFVKKFDPLVVAKSGFRDYVDHSWVEISPEMIADAQKLADVFKNLASAVAPENPPIT